MKFSKVNHKKVNKEMLPQIINRIFSICKTDKNFPMRGEISDVDKKMSIFKEKIRRQDVLFKQSQKLTYDLNERMNILEDRNENLKEILLESLGSEL